MSLSRRQYIESFERASADEKETLRKLIRIDCVQGFNYLLSNPYFDDLSSYDLVKRVIDEHDFVKMLDLYRVIRPLEEALDKYSKYMDKLCGDL